MRLKLKASYSMMLGHMYICISYLLPESCNYCFLGCCSSAENNAWGQWHSWGGLIPRCLEPPKTVHFTQLELLQCKILRYS